MDQSIQYIQDAITRGVKKFEAIFPECAARHANLGTHFDPSRLRYKRCHDVIIVLYLPDDVKTNETRWVKDVRFAKYRANQVFCVFMYNTHTNKKEHRCNNKVAKNPTLTYEVFKWSVPDFYDSDIDAVCTGGIHYFQTLIAAICYVYGRYALFHADGSVLGIYDAFPRFEANPNSYEQKKIETSLGVQHLFFYNDPTYLES